MHLPETASGNIVETAGLSVLIIERATLRQLLLTTKSRG